MVTASEMTKQLAMQCNQHILSFIFSKEHANYGSIKYFSIIYNLQRLTKTEFSLEMVKFVNLQY